MSSYGGLYPSHYEKIKKDLLEIKKDQEYPNLGVSFAYWYLEGIEGLEDNTAQEAIVDGTGDWGIDAIIIDEDQEKIKLYQFKFPEESDNIGSKVDKNAITSLLTGYKFCSKGEINEKTNKLLAQKINEIYESEIFNYEFNIVSYGTGISDEASIVLNSELDLIKSTGNDVKVNIVDRDKIIESIRTTTKMKEIKLTLPVKGYNELTMENDDTETHTIYVSLKDIAKTGQKYGDSLYDENVRLFHGKDNKFNKKIIETATSDDAKYFHLFNNGITIVADQVKVSAQTNRAIITNPSVINGCQTMNSLTYALENGDINEFGLVKVSLIQTSNLEIRKNISIYSNSQTEIKDSYLISNLPVIYDLEKLIEEQGYIFERQANKVKLLKQRLSRKEKTEKLGIGNNKVITLESAIQLFATFYMNLAPIAKSNKGKLFESGKTLEKILDQISPEKVILAHVLYGHISKRLKEYRSYRRNEEKTEILDFLKIKDEDINHYLFLNTGDLFLLSGMAVIYKYKINKKDTEKFNIWSQKVIELKDDVLREAIISMREVINDMDVNSTQISSLTKLQSFHNDYIKFLHTKYNK